MNRLISNYIRITLQAIYINTTNRWYASEYVTLNQIEIVFPRFPRYIRIIK